MMDAEVIGMDQYVTGATIRALREKYPRANIVPIDHDPGATRVNQENRLKLMLAVAREEG